MNDDRWCGLEREALLGMLRRMAEIRVFENEVMNLFSRNLVRASTHLCQGQEAVSVGACSALGQSDTMTCTYRGHGAVLAMGAPLDRSFGEILGREGGLCGGRGGSMHLTDLSVGALGSFAVVGAHLPFACGDGVRRAIPPDRLHLPLLLRRRRHEHRRLPRSDEPRSIWKLPVVFVCENNLYGEYSPMATTTPVTELAGRAASYAMPADRVDGNDVLAVYEAVRVARERASGGDGPTMIEALTYRHMGHSRSDPATYRPDGELDAWLKRDPIVLFKRSLAERDDIATEELEAVEAAAAEAVKLALGQALEWPEPDPAARFDYVFAPQ